MPRAHPHRLAAPKAGLVELVARPELLRSDEREELKQLRKENAELRRANAILKDASVYFATELDPTRRG